MSVSYISHLSRGDDQHSRIHLRDREQSLFSVAIKGSHDEYSQVRTVRCREKYAWNGVTKRRDGVSPD